jgi:Xaa-Pro dipeptidase
MSFQTVTCDPTALDEYGFPHFSFAEIDRRRDELLRAADEAGVAALVLYGSHRVGSAVPWLTEWPTTREAVVVVSPGYEDVLLVQHHNHVPQARHVARGCEVRWGGPDTMRSLVDELRRRGVSQGRIGWMGPLAAATSAGLDAEGFQCVDLSGVYTRLRLRKSPEEIQWLRYGAELSDAGLRAMVDGLRPGLSEGEIVSLIEGAYVPAGATTIIHHLATTSMSASDTGVPRQFVSGRRLQSGDCVTTEISASWWGYPGQVLRSCTVDAEPTPLYRDMHRVADEALAAVLGALRPGATAQDLVDASGVIEDSGFTIIDDLVHGFGGGYLPPVLGSRSRPSGPVPDFTFEPGMAVVIQPNVTTLDWQAGVQTGELVLVTEEGVERLHSAPTGFLSATSR